MKKIFNVLFWILIALLIFFFLLIVSFVLFGSPNISDDREINDNVCVKFENPSESAGDYENVIIRTYECDSGNIIDKHETFECPIIRHENDEISIGINRICRFWITHETHDDPEKMKLRIDDHGFFHEIQ